MTPELLDFHLPPFVRTTWASRALRATWEPRMEAAREALDATRDVMLLDEACGVGARLVRTYPYQVDGLRGSAEAEGMSACRVDISEAHMSALYPFDFVDDDRLCFVLLGRPGPIARALAAIEAQDAGSFHEALGVPSCCHGVHEAQRASGMSDTTWLSGGGGRQDVVVTSVSANVLLRRIGLSPLEHAPCSYGCAESTAMVSARIAVLERHGFDEGAHWLREILSWPMSWSALHGIAEIKLPVAKIVYDTDATARRLSVELHSDHRPSDAPRGLGFPFRAPPRRLFSDSPSFRRGLANTLDDDVTA